MTNGSAHPTEEDLILYCYGEVAGDEVHRIESHLHVCGACASVWTELRHTLHLVDQASVPEPGPAFERVTWTRVQTALAERRPEPWRFLGLRLVPLAATVLISVTAGAAGWRLLHQTPAATVAGNTATVALPAAVTKPAVSQGERVLLTALDDHFQQAQTLLIELQNAPDDVSDLDFERATAGDLIASGRLYRAAARQHGDRQMADMLDDLESVLVDVARREHINAADLHAVRARIDAQDLLFKVRTAAKQVQQREKSLLTAGNE